MEPAVKRVKAVLRRVSEESAGPRRTLWARFMAGLMEMRATPLRDGVSPMEWMLHRQPRTTVPGSGASTSTHRCRAEALSRRREETKRQRAKVDCHARPLDQRRFKVGQQVVLYDNLTKRWDCPAVVIRLRRGGRSIVAKAGNREYIRNRRFVRAALPEPPDAQPRVNPGDDGDGSVGEQEEDDDRQQQQPETTRRRPQRDHWAPARLQYC